MYSEPTNPPKPTQPNSTCRVGLVLGVSGLGWVMKIFFFYSGMGWVWVLTITTSLAQPDPPIYLKFKKYIFNIYLKLYYIINKFFYLIFFLLFSSSYIKPNYLANPNNLISLSGASHSYSLTPLLFFCNWVGILVHVYFVYQLSWIYFVYNWIEILVHVYFIY